MVEDNVKEILERYSKKIEKQMGDYNQAPQAKQTSDNEGNFSREFNQFKQDMMPELSKYERWTKNFGSFIKLKLAKKDDERLSKELAGARLDVTPGEVVGLAISAFFAFALLGSFLAVGLWMLTTISFPYLFIVLILFASAFVFYYFYSMPARLATKWRLKASSQMVPAILYTVVYMKHTSNLERAISFVSQHVDAPLSLDLKKVIWDVETGKYSSIKDSLDVYLDSWKEHSIEFVESFHLIESSLYEPSEARRIQILERSLKVILEGVYDKMLKYTHTIKSPLTNLYMLGIVLPTLGLAMLPLASTMLDGAIKWSHVFILFNIIIPFFVFYMTSQIMLKRPGGYGETSLLEKNPNYYKYKSKKPYFNAFLICLPFFLLGIIPILFGYTSLPQSIGLEADYNLADFKLGIFGDKFFDFRIHPETGRTVGPFGVPALLLSLFIPFSIALFFTMSFSARTKELIKTRDESKALEKEFTSSLFTLGNRLGDGLPAEIAFSKVAESTRGQKTENFFKIVSSNIQSMGMSLENAIFNPKRGALVYYPSSLIATSMKILIESVKKGLKVAAASLMSISEYVRNISKINERLKDLLADIASDMKSNMTFLAPLLAGIVVGLAAMITSILGMLEGLTASAGDVDALGFAGGLSGMFEVTNMVPPYFMQIAIGIYIIQVIFILTSTLVTVDAGEDKLKQTHEIAKNLRSGSLLYLITAFVAVSALALLAGIVLKSMGTF